MRILGTHLEITRRHARHAGRARVATGSDFIDALQDASARRLNLAPIAGAAGAQYVQLTAAAAALTNSQVAYIGPLVGVGQAPLVLGFHHVPVTSAATAATTVTINANRTDTPAVIGGVAFLTATADTAPRGPSFPFIIPFGIPATSGVSISGAESGAAGIIMTGSATLPILLIALQVN